MGVVARAPEWTLALPPHLAQSLGGKDKQPRVGIARNPSSDLPERAGWVETGKRGLKLAIPMPKRIRRTPFMARNGRVKVIVRKVSGTLKLARNSLENTAGPL